MKLEDVAENQPATDVDSSDSDGSAVRKNNNDLSNPSAQLQSRSSSNMASCGVCSFPVSFIFSFIQFAIYLNKLYQDSALVATYYGQSNLKLLAISILSLVSPVILFIVFLVGGRLAKQNDARCRDWFTNFIYGVLLIPWQIKGRAEVLHFTSQRICDLRRPTEDEQNSIETLKRQANVLEFFESFYASMIQLVLQLFILIVNLENNQESRHLIVLIVSSILPLYCVIQAVRRRDDGLLTSLLSTIGWSAFFASRTMAFALGAYAIRGWIVVVCAIHVLMVSAWITVVAWRAHKELTFRRKTAVAFLVTTLFGIPSLAYWPIMFQLKEAKRPLIFFMICVLENSALFLFWFLMRPHWKIGAIHEQVMVGILLAGMLIGCLLLGLYVLCKPKYTDQVVMYNMKVDNANSYGIFFDFCDATFPLPSTDRIQGDLQIIRGLTADTNTLHHL